MNSDRFNKNRERLPQCETPGVWHWSYCDSCDWEGPKFQTTLSPMFFGKIHHDENLEHVIKACSESDL